MPEAVVRAFAPSRQPPGRPWEGKQMALWALAIVVLVLSVALFEYVRGGGRGLLGQAAYLPILLAAAVLGLRGGAVVGLLVTLLMTPVMLLGPREGWGGDPWWVRVAFYAVFGVLVGLLFQMLEKRLKRLEERTERLSLAYTQTLSSLAHTVEVRDRHTQGHSERVARNALVLGRELGFTGKHLQVLYWSAMLHDLGKIAIADYILLKDGPLSAAEYDEVKRHPELGAELLASLSGQYAPIAEVVRSHHERWDGGGYPRGLAATQIPLMGRIISVVDVFEALTSDRPYRRPMSPEAALEFLVAGAGEQFDPNLVDVFVACYERGELLAAGQSPAPTSPPARAFLAQAPA